MAMRSKTFALPLGKTVDRSGRLHDLTLDGRVAMTPGTIVGMTGAGKTALVSGLGWSFVKAGGTLILVEPKGDLVPSFARHAPVLARSIGITPEEILVLRPLGKNAILAPLNFMRLPLPAGQLAPFVVSLYEQMLGDSYGVRMTRLVHARVNAAIAAKGNFAFMRQLLHDEELRRRAAHICDPETAEYLRSGFERESASTIAAVDSRDALFASNRGLYAAFNAGSCLWDEVLKHRLVLVDVSGGSLGQAELSYSVASMLLSWLLGLIFERDVDETTSPVVVVVDELQSIARHSATDVTRAIQEIRFKRATVWNCTQSLAQVRNDELKTAISSNIGWFTALAPRKDEVALVEHLLPEPTGTVRDARQRGVRLTPAAEALEARKALRRLRKREGIFANFQSGEDVRVFRTANYPFDELDKRVARLPQDVIDSYAKGGVSMTIDELEADAAVPDLPALAKKTPVAKRPPLVISEPSKSEPAPQISSGPTEPSPRKKRRKKPKLVLP
jgi:hypothetical protein